MGKNKDQNEGSWRKKSTYLFWIREKATQGLFQGNDAGLYDPSEIKSLPGVRADGQRTLGFGTKSRLPPHASSIEADMRADLPLKPDKTRLPSPKES